MVEKGTDKPRGNGLISFKKGHTRVVRNSNPGAAFLHNIASSPGSVGKNLSSDLHTDGLGKKMRRSASEMLISPLTPNSRQGSPSTKVSCSPRTSPCHYAGAKFSEPPSADSLPKPPTHWMGICVSPMGVNSVDKYREISQQLKMMLKVQA